MTERAAVRYKWFSGSASAERAQGGLPGLRLAGELLDGTDATAKPEAPAAGFRRRDAMRRMRVSEAPATRTGKSVAVVGSGPAGLACAAELRRHGIDRRGAKHLEIRPHEDRACLEWSGRAHAAPLQHDRLLLICLPDVSFSVFF